MTRRRLLLVVAVALAFQESVCYGQEPKAVLKGEGGPVWSVAFSPDGKTLAAGFMYDRMELWEVLSGMRRATLKHLFP
jgi:hypothetical protein